MKPLLNTTLALCLLASIGTAWAAESDETPKQSPELKVLDHFAGTWKTVITGKAGDQSFTETDFVTRTWSTDGQFLLEQARFQQNSSVTRSRGAWTYDPTSKSYRMVLLTRNLAILGNCQWNEKTKTMTFRGIDHADNTFTSSHRVINKDDMESSTVVKNADGNVIAEMTHKQTRVKANAAAKIGAAKNDGDELKRSSQLQVLDRFVGTWKQALEFKAGERTGTETSVRTRAWSDGGKGNLLVEENAIQPGDRTTHGVYTYDPDSKSYRAISMGRNYALIANGVWDEKIKTMTWRHMLHNGNSGRGSHRFIDADHADWSLAFKKAGGGIGWKGSAKQTRVIGHPRKPQ